MITLASQWNEYRDGVMQAERRRIDPGLVLAAELGFYAGALRMMKLINALQQDRLFRSVTPDEVDNTISAWLAEIGRRNEEFGREIDG